MPRPARVALPLLVALLACGRGGPSGDSAQGATSGASAAAPPSSAPGLTPGDTAVRGASTAAIADSAAVQRPSSGAVAPRSTRATAATPPQGAAGQPASPPSTPQRAPARQLAPQQSTGQKPAPPAAEPHAAAPAAGAPAAAANPAESARAAAPASAPAPTAASPQALDLPFSVGEKLEYQVKYGFLGVGRASMQVEGIEDVRGTRALHTLFRVQGGIKLYSVNDRYESWFDPRTFSSLRFAAQIDEGNYERERRFEIYPERQTYSENGGPEQPSVAQPLDDGSFIYFVRDFLHRNAVEVGKEYTFDRYFRPDRNPVRLRILRRERVKVPAGTFDAIVVQPIIRTTGIFGEGGKAQIWFTDDSTRTMLQMKSSLKFGSLNLYLTKRTPGS